MTAKCFDPLLPGSSDISGVPANRLPVFEPLSAVKGRSSTCFELISHQGPTKPAVGGVDTVDAVEHPPSHSEADITSTTNTDETRHDRHWIATQELQRQHEAELDQLRKQHEADIAALNEKHAGENAAYIDDAFKRVLATLAHAMEKHLVTILGMVLTNEHRSRCIEALVEKARSIAEDPSVARLELNGPPELVESFRRQMGEQVHHFTIATTDGMDLHLAVDDAVLSTRFRDWQQELERVAYER